MVSALTAIKLLHTVIWAFLAASILALPVTGWLRRFRWAAILSLIVLLECGVLVVNGGRCPLTDVAARLTLNRAANFDIYLPNWLAEHNKLIFGVLLVAGELVVLWCWRGSTMKDALRAGVLYFLIVFATGFLLGTIRTLWVAPKLGVRTAELIEAPLMFGVSILAARWVVRWLALSSQWSARFLCGAIALGLMLLSEFTLVRWIRGLTIREYFATRDPISGTVYYLTLVAFAVIPIFVRTRKPTLAAAEHRS